MAMGTALVTGAAVAGYARAITDKLLGIGYQVIGTYQRDGKTAAIEFGVSRKRLKLFEVNLESRSELAGFVKRLSGLKLNLVVNAQFFWNMEKPNHFDHDLWDRSIAVNLTARNYLVQELKPQIVDGGSIVSITSTEGLTGSFGGSAYAAARAAEHNLVKTFANNLGARNVRANAIATGWIGSVMDTDEVFNRSRQITPLGRLGTPEEVANIVMFLASEQASFINGQVIVADGGYSGVDAMAKYEFEHNERSNK